MRLRILSVVIVLLIAALGYVAWNRNTGPANPGGTSAAPEPSAPAGGSGEASPPATGGMPPAMEQTAADPGVAWTKPHRWNEELASGMRIASYAVPGPSGSAAASCAVYYFGPGQGGGTDANIERWAGEFENPGTPQRTERTVGGMKVTEVQLSGTYRAHAGMSGGGSDTPSPNWALRAAIVEGPSGELFFKLTGPRSTVEPAGKEFEGLIASLRKK